MNAHTVGSIKCRHECRNREFSESESVRLRRRLEKGNFTCLRKQRQEGDHLQHRKWGLRQEEIGRGEDRARVKGLGAGVQGAS